jgi:biotin synthase
MFARLGIKPMAVTQTQAEVDAERMPRGCAKLEAAE